MSIVTCAPELRITLPAEQASLGLLRHVVRGFRDAYGVDAAAMDDIMLAVSEAAANCVVHAYGRRRGTFTVVGRVDGENLHVLVRDHGRGITSPADVPVLGHGLALMEHVASSLEVLGSPAGTDVTMTFKLDREPAWATLRDHGGAAP